MIKHQTSNIKHQTSNIKHQTSNIKHQTSNIKHQTSNIKHQRHNKVQHSTRNQLDLSNPELNKSAQPWSFSIDLCLLFERVARFQEHPGCCVCHCQAICNDVHHKIRNSTMAAVFSLGKQLSTLHTTREQSGAKTTVSG